MITRRKMSRRRKSALKKTVTRTGSLVTAASRRHGAGVAIWIVAAFAAIALAGHAASKAAGPRLPQHLEDAEALDHLVQTVASNEQTAPADASRALGRVYVEGLRSGPLTQEAIQALRRSYRLEPLGPDATLWRLGFIFNHWTAMPDDIRLSARRELKAAFPRHGWAMRGLPETVSDPSGRMVASLLFEQLRLAQARSDVVQPSAR